MPSLSADQREAIAALIAHAAVGLDNEPVPPLPEDYFLADVLAPLVDGWLGEARRDERERMRDVIGAHRIDWERGDLSGAELCDSLLAHIDPLGVIEGSEASDG